MCQTPLQFSMHWSLLPWRRRTQHGLAAAAAAGAGHGAAAGLAGGAAAAAAGAGDAANNYLLEHQPRLAELLADMPQILAPENVQILAEVQVRRGMVPERGAGEAWGGVGCGCAAVHGTGLRGSEGRKASQPETALAASRF
jgi:hypothetical protein